MLSLWHEGSLLAMKNWTQLSAPGLRFLDVASSAPVTFTLLEVHANTRMLEITFIDDVAFSRFMPIAYL